MASDIVICAARPEHEILRQLIGTEDAAVSIVSRIEGLELDDPLAGS